MTKAGVPMVQALDIVMDGTEKPTTKDLIRQIRNDVSGGACSNSSQKTQPIFRRPFLQSRCGEDSGTLEIMLDRIAVYKEKSEALKATIKKPLLTQWRLSQLR